MPNDRASITIPKPTARSRLTNGRELFLGEVDGRSREARRYRDVYAGLVSHLGGDDIVTEPRRHLAKRASALVVWCEVEEAKLASAADLDIGIYTTAINALRRLLGDLGLERVAVDVSPPLADYLAAKSVEVSP